MSTATCSMCGCSAEKYELPTNNGQDDRIWCKQCLCYTRGNECYRWGEDRERDFEFLEYMSRAGAEQGAKDAWNGEEARRHTTLDHKISVFIKELQDLHAHFSTPTIPDVLDSPALWYKAARHRRKILYLSVELARVKRKVQMDKLSSGAYCFLLLVVTVLHGVVLWLSYGVSAALPLHAAAFSLLAGLAVGTCLVNACQVGRRLRHLDEARGLEEAVEQLHGKYRHMLVWLGDMTKLERHRAQQEKKATSCGNEKL